MGTTARIRTLRPAGLLVSGARDEPRRPYPNYPEYLLRWDAWMNAVEPTTLDPTWSAIRDGLAGYRSVWWQPDFWTGAAHHRTPMLAVQG